MAWLAAFFTRVVNEKRIPKAWRRAKVIALAKSGKDPQLPSSYRPISLHSACFELLEPESCYREYQIELMSYSPKTKQVSDAAAGHATKLLL